MRKTTSLSSSDSGNSTSVSMRKEQILPLDKFRALPKGSVLLFATGRPQRYSPCAPGMPKSGPPRSPLPPIGPRRPSPPALSPRPRHARASTAKRRDLPHAPSAGSGTSPLATPCGPARLREAPPVRPPHSSDAPHSATGPSHLALSGILYRSFLVRHSSSCIPLPYIPCRAPDPGDDWREPSLARSLRARTARREPERALA